MADRSDALERRVPRPQLLGPGNRERKIWHLRPPLELSKTPAIELTIDAASLNTNNKKRDTHLRSGDFFDAANHPQVRFVSDSATISGQQLKVRGHLHAAGKSIPVDLDATVRPVGAELEVEAETQANQHHLGMTSNPLGMLRTPSKLIVHGRLVQDDN